MRKGLLLLTVAVLCSCRDPRAEANIAQAMMEVGTTLSTMQQDYASTAGVVRAARGDSSLRIPGRLRFEQPSAKGEPDLIVTWQERALGPELGPDKFALTPPPGLKRCR